LQVADAAIKTLIKLERTDDAINLIGRSIEAQPNEGMYRLRAVLHQANGDTEKATADLDKAIAMSPRDPRTLILRATVALDRDDVKAAKADFRAAATIAPQIMAADQGIELRLQIALKENRMADAINDAKLLMDRQPRDPFRRLRLASLYSIDQRPRKAIELLSNLLEEIPENVSALRSRGDAWLSVGDHAKAIADYESAIAAIGKVTLESSTESEIDEAAGLYNNLAWVLATSPKDDVRSGSRSVELAELSAGLTKYEAPHILSTLAAAYAENGDFENARKWAEKAVELAVDEGHNQLQQLQQELDAYKENKPWREIQEVEENDLPILDPKDLIDT
jgi:tetratricopeptide (TPR) repeat protein